MWFLIFLIIIILIIYLSPLLLRQLMLYIVKKQARNIFGDNDIFGNRRPNNRQPDNRQPGKRHKKKIDPSVGEYVEFVDLPPDAPRKPNHENPKTEPRKPENRIEDVEWVDI